MQASLDQVANAVNSVSEYLIHNTPVDVGSSSVTQSESVAVLPYEHLKYSLLSHPVIAQTDLAATQVYHAIIKLLQSLDSEEEPSSNLLQFDQYFRCRTCKVNSPFLPQTDGIFCPVCGHFEAGYISYENPYREFEGTETRSHWTSTESDNHEHKDAAVMSLSRYFPEMASDGHNEAIRKMIVLSNSERIRSVKVVAAAALILTDNPQILVERSVRVIEPETPSYGCEKCSTAYFDEKSAKYCCIFEIAKKINLAEDNRKRKSEQIS